MAEEVLHNTASVKRVRPDMSNLPRLKDEDSNLAGVFGPSPSQTVGPYFHQGLADHFQGLRSAVDFTMVPPGADVKGERITLTGFVFDGDGQPVEDAMIEVWQPDADGNFSTASDAPFHGFGRTHTRSADFSYTLHTLKPGGAAGGAPKLAVWLGMRGLLTHLITFIYFSDEDNSGDPYLNAVPEPRRHTLIAQRHDTQGGTLYRFDFRMQGKDETAFFDAYR